MIGRPNPDGVARLGLEIEAGGCSQRATADIERSVIGGTYSRHQGIRKRVTAIGISSRQGSDHGVGTRVLSDRAARQSDIRRSFVDIDHCDREHLLGEQAPLIRGAYTNYVARLSLEVERVGGSQDRASNIEGSVIGIA